MTIPSSDDVLAKLFPGGSDLAARMRAKDWSQTVLGPAARWPQSLYTLVSVILASPQPAIVYWGREFAILYNDSARVLLGSKHPNGLGETFKVLFPEAWPVLGPLLERVLDTGEAVHAQNLLVPLERKGFLEDCFFTFAYIPAHQEDRQVGGVFVNLTDTTAQVLAARRLEIIREISLRAALCSTVADVEAVTGDVLRKATTDLPFFRLYQVKDGVSRLLTHSGPAEDGDAAQWDLPRLAASEPIQLLALPTAFDAAWKDAPDPRPTRACSISLTDASAGDSRLVLIVGLHPRIAFDDDQRGFLGLLGRQIATSIASSRALEEKTLRAAQLAELDRQKTQFFSNVSHELRTPLTLMLAPVEDLLSDVDEPLSRRQHERIELVERGARRLLRLVNQLLEFTRLEAGRAHARFVPVDLARLTREFVSHFESFARRAGLVLTVDAPELGEPVWVDREAWERIVFNLLSNAFKFTLHGAIRVRLSLHAQEVHLEVHDTGTGISEAELPRIFERFHRIEGAPGRSIEGSGIGLALVQELVKMHHGRVSVASRLGEGSTFTVQLLRGRAHLPVTPASESSERRDSTRPVHELVEMEGWLREDGGVETAPEPSGVPASSVRSAPREREGSVLVVDDNADIRSYLRGVLESSFSVTTAVHGKEALAALQRGLPDVVVSDVMMPELNGFELVRAIRADAAMRAVPVILLSARAGEEAALEGLQTGADDYLVKPFSARELLARVRTQRTLSRLRAESAFQAGRLEALRDAVQSRDDFLSVASHELKTPLAGLKLHLEVLERMVGVAERAKLVERLSAARNLAQRLGALIDSLLDVSLLASGKLHLLRGPVDVSELITSCTMEGSAELARAHCALHLDIQPGLMASVDGVRLRQVVQGLLSNAVRFGAGQPVEVKFGVEGSALCLRVVDHGPGVRETERARIFERFARAVSARNYGGLGLGLWTARQIAEAHGGHLDVEDTPGGGATFVLSLELR